MTLTAPSLSSTEPVPAASGWEHRHARRLTVLAVGVVAVGLAWRLTRYLLAFPVWGDEAMLLVNYLSRGYLDIFGPIDHCQIAPLLFHWAEIAALRTFGSGELAVRLPALLACLGSVALFWRLAALTLPPLARSLAVGILAVSVWPATMGSLCKPYAFDLFFSLALLVPAVEWLRRPDRRALLACLALLVPIALWASYPAVFVAGGVSLALLPDVWRRDAKTRAIYLLVNLLIVSSFLGHYLLVGRAHLASPVSGVTTAAGMTAYWQTGFPPAAPAALLRWLLLTHVGQTAAYPVGGANGASLLTVLAATAGAWSLWRRGQTRLLLAVAGTFGLWLAAAVLRKYPYGMSCRLAQHVAPFYCLLAGAGLAVLLERLAEARRWRGTVAVGGLLVAIGLTGLARDVWRPYRDADARWARQVADELFAGGATGPLLLACPEEAVPMPLLWYLQSRTPVGRLDRLDAAALAGVESALVVDTRLLDDSQARVARQLGEGWRLADRQRSRLVSDRLREPFLECRIDRWIAESSARTTAATSR